jgi:hypothetical protein
VLCRVEEPEFKIWWRRACWRPAGPPSFSSPVAAYLAADAETVPHLWLVTQERFWSIYVVFVIVRLPRAAVVALYWRRLVQARDWCPPRHRHAADHSDLRLGANNDFSMRVSILPLALPAFVFIVARLCPPW